MYCCSSSLVMSAVSCTHEVLLTLMQLYNCAATGLTVVVSLSTTDVNTGDCKLKATATDIATLGTASVTVILPATGTTAAMMSDDSIYIHCSSVTPEASWPVISAAVTVSNGNAVTAFSGVALTVYDVPTQPTGVR
jgi:hypothetical protein